MRVQQTLKTEFSREQARFLDRWQLAGGAQAAAEELLQGAGDESVLYSAADGSGWQYVQASAQHSTVLQTSLTGYFQNRLPARHLSFGAMQNDSVFRSGEACVFGWPGAIGAAQRLWSERLVVPVRPPQGMSRAVVSHFSWTETAPLSTLATFAMAHDWLEASCAISEAQRTMGQMDILDKVCDYIRAEGEAMFEALLLRNHLETQLFGAR